jgi:hypothetical protein
MYDAMTMLRSPKQQRAFTQQPTPRFVSVGASSQDQQQIHPISLFPMPNIPPPVDVMFLRTQS